MKIEKIPEGYLLARKGGNGCELWRKFNGAESMACDAIDELIAERDELRAKIERMEQQEPVAWQTRTRPAWNDGTWGPWRKCSEEYAEDIKKTPSLHDWLYEARALYTLPGAKGEEK